MLPTTLLTSPPPVPDRESLCLSDPVDALLDPVAESAAGAGVRLTTGRGGMPVAILEHASGSTAALYLHGAQVTSWRAPTGSELLFVSAQSAFAPDREIRGGVPIAFPQFGRGPLPLHGFARFHDWQMVASGLDERGAAVARLRLRDTEETRSLWPYPFLAEVVVRLDGALGICLSVSNPGSEPCEFTAGFHNYFRVAAIEETLVEGLRGVRYLDKVGGDAERTEEHDALRIGGEVNRIYWDAPDAVLIRDYGNRRGITVRKRGFADLVVWNPWIDWSREHEDFGDKEYLDMLCVETVQLGEGVRLAPGEHWTAAQTLSYMQQP